MPDHASPTTHFWDPAYYRPASDDFSIQAYPQGQDRPNHPTERPDNRFARQFSDQEMPSSTPVLAQLDSNLHPSTKPYTAALSVASRSRAEQMNNRSVMSIHASTEVAGQELQKLLAFSSRLQSLEDRVHTLQLCRQYSEAADSRMQASIQAQQSMLTQLCSSIDRLAATSTEATKATTNLAENSSAAAAAATAASQAQLQQAQAASGVSSRGLPGPLSRAAAECVVSNAGYVSTLVLKGVAKMAAEADVVAAILCHKVLLSEYVPPRAAAGGAAGGRRAEFLTLRNAKTAGTFLLALEAAWNLSGRSMRMLPRPLVAVASPLLRPLRVCMGYVRWTCWAALCYLLARTAQNRVAALRPAAAGSHAAAATAPVDEVPLTPPSIASHSAATVAPAAPATAPAAGCITPEHPPVVSVTAAPSSAPGVAVLSPLATVVTRDGKSQANAGVGGRARSRTCGRGSVVAAELAAMADEPGKVSSGQVGRAAAALAAVGVRSGCCHGYADSCPHGCDVFGEDGRVLYDENSLQEVGEAAGEDGVGIAGYVMQHGMQLADAARAWASRSRNFVRV